jgi:hypothetical protein
MGRVVWRDNRVERDDLWETSNHWPNVEANSSDTPGERIIEANDNV